MFRFIPDEPTVNFIGTRYAAFVLSMVLLGASLFLLATRGLDYGIDFTGGTVMEVRVDGSSISELRGILNDGNVEGFSLQSFGTEHDYMIRFGGAEREAQLARINEVKALLNANVSQVDYRKVDFVGPQVGHELIKAGALSLGLATLAILLYIWLRFEWQFGLGAVVALVHDIILTLGLYSFLQLEFNLTSIAAILTIIGYSINDSVVIYDRVREMLRKYRKLPLHDVLNKSINSTLSRTILTAGSTVAALAALVWLGGDVIYGFSVAVLFGVLIGTYSSIYIAAPLLTVIQPKRQAVKSS